MAENVHASTLESGLTVLARESHDAPVAELQIWACVGSADERPGEAGLAHFHEHMLFKGTEQREVDEIAGAVEAVGGRINAFTTFDATCYYATVPSEGLGLAVDVLSDVVQHSLFDPEEVTREIQVVLEEIRRSEDDPHSVLSDEIFATVYRVHPYRAPILGTAESVGALSRERLRAFYDHWYAPQNLVVTAVGDFESAALVERIRSAFAGSRGGPSLLRTRAAEPSQEALRVRVVERPFERVSLDLSWSSVPLAHEDAAILDLLAFVLGEGDSSRLVRRVKEERALADRIDASSFTPLDPGMFGVTADAEPKRALALVEAVVAETERLRREPVSAEELEKARTNFLSVQHWQRESVSGMARKLGSFQTLAGTWSYEETYLERIRRAKPEDLLRVAETWLAPERLSLAAVAPEGNGAVLAPEAFAAAVGDGSAAAARRFRPPIARGREGEDIEGFELPGGVRLHVQRRRHAPVVALRAAMLGGQLVEHEESAGLSHFLAGMWLRGTESLSAADFARRVESVAADVDGFSGRSSSGLTADCLSDHLETVLDLFSEALLAPAFAPEEIERERRETQASLIQRADRLSARAFDLFSATLWRRHPYRSPIPGRLETVSRFDRKALAELQERLVRANNLVLAVVGDVEPEAVAAGLARRLAPLESGARIESDLPAGESAAHEIRVVEEHVKERAQAHLVLGFAGLALADPDREALEVLTQVLGGQGGRLFLELRDREGLAYTVSAVNGEAFAPGYWAVYMGTAPENIDAARSGIVGQLRRVLDQPPGPEEIEAARRHLVGNFAIDQQRSSTRALHMALDARYGLGANGEAGYLERIRAVRAEDVARVAARVIDLDAYALAIIRP